MLIWLVRLWHRLEEWMHHRSLPEQYHRSNLHGRHR